MRTLIFISILSLWFILACNKEDHGSENTFPVTYEVFLELQKSDGTSFNEGEIEAKGAYLNKEGQLIFIGDWFQLPVDSGYSKIFEKTVFGPFEIGIGSEGDNELEPGIEWVSNQLLLLRYQGITEIDTLRSRDSARYPDFRYFDIFKNTTLIQRFNDPKNYIERPWYISITK